jgi:hypothetical protein
VRRWGNGWQRRHLSSRPSRRLGLSADDEVPHRPWPGSPSPTDRPTECTFGGNLNVDRCGDRPGTRGVIRRARRDRGWWRRAAARIGVPLDRRDTPMARSRWSAGVRSMAAIGGDTLWHESRWSGRDHAACQRGGSRRIPVVAQRRAVLPNALLLRGPEPSARAGTCHDRSVTRVIGEVCRCGDGGAGQRSNPLGAGIAKVATSVSMP